MPYTRVTRTKNGAEAIKYALGDGTGHNGADTRNVFVTGLNMLPNNVVPFEQQMQIAWSKMSRRHKVQIDRVIISHSDKELDPSKPEDVLKGHQIACELGAKLAPGHQVIVCTQIDGKGGKIHSHVLLNDADMNGIGLPATQYYHPLIRAEADKICTQYFDLADPSAVKDRTSQTVRAKRELNEQAVADGRPEDVVYIWQDDLKMRIKTAAAAATDEQDFYQQLTAHGVEGTFHKGTDKRDAYITYELVDTTGFPDLDKIPKNLKGRSYKLGADYSLDSLSQSFKNGQQKPIEQPVSDFEVKAGSSPSKAEKTAPAASEGEISPMDRAREAAKSKIISLYTEKRWGWAIPTDENGDPDYQEAKRRREQANESWDGFMKWRTEQRKQGRKLGSIYIKQSEDYVAVDMSELTAQYTEYERGGVAKAKPTEVKAEPETKAATPVVKEDDKRSELYRQYQQRRKILQEEAEREEKDGLELF